MSSDASTTGTGPYTNVYFFTQVTESNHAGYLWIAGILSLLYPIISGFVRLSVRAAAFGLDDYVLVGATIVSIGQHVAVFVALAKGLGHTGAYIRASGELETVTAAILAARVLYILVQTAAKASLALFIRRLFNNSARLNFILCNGLVAATIIWGVSALIILEADCPLSLIPSEHAQCTSTATRWWIVVALDIATELLLIAIPSILVSGVMIKFQAKALVGVAFACRLPLIVFAVLLGFSISSAGRALDRAMAYVDIALWFQVMICWSLISASIPSFKAFMHPFDAVAGGGERFNADGSTGAYLMMGREKSKKGTQNRSQVRSGKSAQSGASSALGRLRGDHVDQQTTIGPGARRDNDGGDSMDSQADIIRRDRRWEVSYGAKDS